MVGCEELMTEIDEEIATLTEKLNATDYVTAKIIEADTLEEQHAIREQYADVIAQRKQWRARINELEDNLINPS